MREMVAGMAGEVTVDEASILRDFFRVQSDKHGPELLSRLNNIQYGQQERVEGRVKMEQVVEEVIKQEIGAEAALRNSSPGSECSSEGPGPCLPEHVAMAFGPPGARALGPWLLGPGGLLLSLPQNMVSPPSQRRLGVSVIQKAPPRGPALYLERRGGQGAGPLLSSQAPLQLLKRKAAKDGDGGGLEGPLSKRRSNQQQSDHLICEVCGERAGKHSYYGGQVSHLLPCFSSCHVAGVPLSHPAPLIAPRHLTPPSSRSAHRAGHSSAAPYSPATTRPSSAARAWRTATSPSSPGRTASSAATSDASLPACGRPGSCRTRSVSGGSTAGSRLPR